MAEEIEERERAYEIQRMYKEFYGIRTPNMFHIAEMMQIHREREEQIKKEQDANKGKHIFTVSGFINWVNSWTG